MVQNEKIAVGIFMVTYNHENYITQAVESIMRQKTSFPFKLFIGEDCSTDNTRSICIELSKRFPEKIELILNEKNLGPLKNAANIYAKCVEYGKYIAICEGDDYWIGTNKLQMQVEFLENNQDYSLACHRAMYRNEIEKKITYPKVLKKDTFQQKDVAEHNFIQTLSVVFRSKYIKDGLPKAYFSSVSGDYFINMLVSQYGKIKYFPNIMAAYRQTGKGIWTSLSKIKGIENTLIVLNHYLKTNIADDVKENLIRNIVKHNIISYNLHLEINEVEKANKSIEDILSVDYSIGWKTYIKHKDNFNTRKKECRVGKLILLPLRKAMSIVSKIRYIIHKTSNK